MKIDNCSPALFVEDIEVSKLFYTKVLNLNIDLDFGKNIIFKEGFAIWEIQQNHIIPQTLGIDNISNKSSNRFELYFETEDIKEVFSELKKSNTKFLHEIHEETWGQKTIRFFDPDNHLIEIGEALKVFITRFYNQGLSVEQISGKTSVPVEEVKRLLVNKFKL